MKINLTKARRLDKGNRQKFESGIETRLSEITKKVTDLDKRSSEAGESTGRRIEAIRDELKKEIGGSANEITKINQVIDILDFEKATKAGLKEELGKLAKEMISEQERKHKEIMGKLPSRFMEVENFCAKCGMVNAVNSKFCVMCGQRLGKKVGMFERRTAKDNINCRRCGAVNDADGSFCRMCGHKL